MNGYQVQDEWIKAAMRASGERVANTRRLGFTAQRWLQRELPDICDCPFALDAALRVRAARGSGNVTAAEVREWRDGLMRRAGVAA